MDMAAVGELTWCLNNSIILLEENFDIGIDGPSYDCGRAVSVNEHTICNTPSLWGLDRALTVFYLAARSRKKGHELSHLKVTQAQWLKDRQNCESDIKCSTVLYYRRIEDLLQ